MKDSCCKEGESKGVGFAVVGDASNVTDGLQKAVANFEGSRGSSKGGGSCDCEAGGVFKQITKFGGSK